MSSSDDDSDLEPVNILPSVDDNARPDAIGDDIGLESDMDSKSDNTEMVIPAVDENAVDFQSHLTAPIEGSHILSKQNESNGEYFDNEGEDQPLYETDSHSEAGELIVI